MDDSQNLAVKGTHVLDANITPSVQLLLITALPSPKFVSLLIKLEVPSTNAVDATE
jgi:hypothetical protein